MRVKRTVLTLLTLIWLVGAPSSLAEDPAAKVRAQLEERLAMQSAAWSSGDLESFSSIYADDSVFVSTSGLTRGGPTEIHERYLKRYPPTPPQWAR